MNPEFLRHVWLEINPHRLIAMPVVLALIFSLAYSINDNNLGLPIARTALWVFAAIGLLWGTRVASDSVAEEIREKTWDTQMMSAMAPWSMTWGKLLGSTVYIWYGSILCLLVFAINAEYSSIAILTKALIIATCAAIFCQAFGMLISLLAVRNRTAIRTSITLLAQLLGLMYLFPFLTHLFRDKGEVFWFGIEWSWIDFGLLSLGLAAAWTVIGVYRLTATILQIRTTPLAWLIFSLIVAGYCAGFGWNESEIKQRPTVIISSISFAAFCALSYIAAFTDRRDTIELRRFFFVIKQRNWKRASEQTPYWTASYLLALFTAVIIFFGFNTELPINKMYKFLLGHCLPASLLVARDIGILYYFSLAPNPKRAVSATIFYLTCLYGLLPALFTAIDLHLGRIAVLPVMGDHIIGSIIIALIHVIIAWWLVIQRWRRSSSI